MTWSAFFMWAGTICSIVGAAFSLWQAMQAKSASKSAKETLGKIHSRHEHVELTKLDGMAKTARDAMDKYGPGAGPINRRGASVYKDTAVVREFSAALMMHDDMLRKAFGSSHHELYVRLNALLATFASTSGDEQVQAGAEIYHEVVTFSGNLKKALDQKMFEQPPAEVRT